MLNAEADLASDEDMEDDEDDDVSVRPRKRLRAKSPSLALDDEEEMIAGIVGDDEYPVGLDGDVGLSDVGGNEEDMGVDDIYRGGNDFGGGVDNGVISTSSLISDNI